MSAAIDASEDRRETGRSRRSWFIFEMTYGPGALLLLGLLGRKTRAAVRPRKRRTRSFWVSA